MIAEVVIVSSAIAVIVLELCIPKAKAEDRLARRHRRSKP